MKTRSSYTFFVPKYFSFSYVHKIMLHHSFASAKNNTHLLTCTTVLLGAYLLAAVAARVPSSKLHIPFISTLRICDVLFKFSARLEEQKSSK